MNQNNVLKELNALIVRLDTIIDIMLQSTKHFIDTGNVNYELKNIIDELDLIIDIIDDLEEINILESAKYDITYATIDIIDNADIFDKIKRLRDAKSSIMEIKKYINSNGKLSY